MPTLPEFGALAGIAAAVFAIQAGIIWAIKRITK
jgi:hypothetical protein